MASFAKHSRRVALKMIQLENREFRRKVEDLLAKSRGLIAKQQLNIAGGNLQLGSGIGARSQARLLGESKRQLIRFREADQLAVLKKNIALANKLPFLSQRKQVLKRSGLRSAVQGLTASVGKTFSATNQ